MSDVPRPANDLIEVGRQGRVNRGDRADRVEDPYRCPPTITGRDLYLIGEGRHDRLWQVLGAHPRDTAAGPGTAFTVWAPHARAVRVCGDFNGWDGRSAPMRRLDPGVWEVFVPGVRSGARYRFQVLGADGHWRDKADPMAQATTEPPAIDSVVYTSTFAWSDADWLERRARVDHHRCPMSVYEVHPGSWRGARNYRQLAHELADYVVELGFTHVELMPLTEHPYGGSWGYQVTSYYAPTARYGAPDDLRYLVDLLHAHGVGVILDWVPAHFPRDPWALADFDGSLLYEHPDPLRRDQPDWGTLTFDHGRPHVRNFLTSSARDWLEEYHIDGLRVDAVAAMLYLDYSRPAGRWRPNVYGGREDLEAAEFLRELTGAIRAGYPGAQVVAEDSSTWPGVTADAADGGLGFHRKWNLGWMHDTLEYLKADPPDRARCRDRLVLPASYALSERYVLPLSHDEVVHGKGSLWGRMPGDDSGRAASLRTLFAWMWAHPGKKLLFMGGEFGQVEEWDDSGPLRWSQLDQPLHRGVQRLVADLNRIYRDTPALYTWDDSPEGFTWLDAGRSAPDVFSFVRRGSDGSALVCVANFAGVDLVDHPVVLPWPGAFEVVLDTDAAVYGGGGTRRASGTPGPRRAAAQPPTPTGAAATAVLDLPASTVLYLAAVGG